MSNNTLPNTQPINTQSIPDKAVGNPEGWLFDEPAVRQPQAGIGATAIGASDSAPSANEVTPEFVREAHAAAIGARQSVDPHRYDDLGRSTVAAGLGINSALTTAEAPLSDASEQARAEHEFAEAMRLEATQAQPAGKPNVLAELGYEVSEHEELIIPERFSVRAMRGALGMLRRLRPRVHLGAAGGAGLAH